MDQDILTDVPESVTIIVTPSMLVQEVRDRIREAFRLHMFDGQPEQLTLHHEEESFPAFACEWTTIFATLIKHPESHSTCLIRLREDEEILWEYGRPPAVLQDYIDAKNGDVIPETNHTLEHVETV